MGDEKHRLIVCQHCGNIWLVHDDLRNKWTVTCDCGFAGRKIGSYDTEREAIRAWNYVAMDWEG